MISKASNHVGNTVFAALPSTCPRDNHQPSALMETDEDSKRLLDCPEEILVLVASALTGTPKSLLAFGAAARSLAALLLRGDEAAVLWDAASAREVRRRRPSRRPWSFTP